MQPRAEQPLFDALRAYDLPVGVYVVRTIDGVETIVKVNLEFLRIFGHTSFDEVEGTPVVQFYGDEDTYEEFQQEITRAAEAGTHLHSHHEKLRHANGDLIPLEVHARPDYDEQGALIGRTGIVVPISDLELLLGDIGKVLHRYSHTMVNIRLQMDSLQKALADGDDPFGHPFHVPTYAEVDDILDVPADHLARALGRFLDEVEEGQRVYECLPPDTWERLKLRLMLFQHYRDHIREPELRPATLLVGARDVLNAFDEMKRGYVAKEVQKDIVAKAKELERLVCLFDLHLSTGQILEMEHEILTARELALYSVRPRQHKDTVMLGDLISEAYRSLEGFAKSRSIEVNIEPVGRRHPKVRVLKRDMVRVVQNLLHNAIKYSWSKPTEQVWIDIHYGVDEETGRAMVRMTNYGVPILAEEIKTGRVYELGYRGSMSGDRSRRGTGIGLYDARRVTAAHGGEVQLESRPASGYLEGVDDSQQPYLTTATLLLPVHI